MRTFFTSDTHFGHTNIIKYCYRPFKTAEEMNQTMVNNWNRVVQDEDIVYHLGDFAFKDFDYYWKILKGNKILIRGNHDDKGIEDAFITFGGVKWHLLHNSDHSDWDNIICGHIHTHWKTRKTKSGNLCINVGVDHWDYTPVPLKTILKLK